jgi:hypothetical protein
MKGYVIIAEVRTGIILEEDGRYRLGLCFRGKEFPTIEEAQKFAINHRLNNPRHECIIYDENEKQLFVYRPTREEWPKMEDPIKPEPWWRFW